MTNAQSEPGPKPAGWVLYDGECGFCSRWLALWKPTLERRHFGVCDLQHAAEHGIVSIPEENLLDDLLIVLPDGSIVRGADAYLYAMRRIWWALPFWALFTLPGFHGLFWWGYRRFAANRYCIPGQRQPRPPPAP